MTLARPAGFTGDIAVEVTGLPGGVAADAVIVPAGATTASLRLEAVASAAAGGPNEIALRAAASDGGAAEGGRALPLYVAGRAGTPDLSYGNAGVALTGGARIEVQGRAIDAQGRVLIAALCGSELNERVLIRFAQDGALDRSLGEGGLVVESEGERSSTYAVWPPRAASMPCTTTSPTPPACGSSAATATTARSIRASAPAAISSSMMTCGDDVRQLAVWRDQVLACSDPGRIHALDPTGAVTMLPVTPEDLASLFEDAGRRLIAASHIFGLPPTRVPLARLSLRPRGGAPAASAS